MASFDIKSLFINIPLTETLNLCVQNLYRNHLHVNNLTESSFYKLLKITMFESFFIFDEKFYEQCDDVAMGSPLGPTLANVFMCHFENIWLENCPSHFKPIVYRWFADDGLFWHFYHFDQRITLQNLEVISMNNIKHKICIRNL